MHNDLNDVIDRVAQELTAAPPPVTLRARVMNRIGTEPVRPRFAWHWRLALVPAAAAIVFVIARQRPDTQGVVTARQTNAVASATIETAAPSLTSAAASNSTARDVKRAASRATDRRIHRAGSEELAWRERAISALTPVDPLDLIDIQPVALSIPQLEVKPLAAADAGSTSGGSIDRHD